MVVEVRGCLPQVLIRHLPRHGQTLGKGCHVGRGGRIFVVQGCVFLTQQWIAAQG